MPVFHFDNKVFYLRHGYQPGDVENGFSEADVRNLTKGGSGHAADACPGDCLAVKNGNAAASDGKDVTDAPTTSTAVEPSNPSGEGSDDPPAPPADPKPEAHTCDVCNDGRAFATAAALGSHKRSKH